MSDMDTANPGIQEECYISAFPRLSLSLFQFWSSRDSRTRRTRIKSYAAISKGGSSKVTILLIMIILGDFPGGPVVKTLQFHCRSDGSIPGQGTKIPHVAWSKKKKKLKK